MGLRLDTAKKGLTVALKAINEECDMNASMSIKEARKHALTADMWLQREIAHQEAKHERAETEA